MRPTSSHGQAIAHVFILLHIMALAALAQAQNHNRRSVLKELEAKYAKVAEAYKYKDIKAFMENKTPDFTGKSLSGNVSSRDQVEAGVRQRMERIKKLNHLRIKIKSLTVTADEAVAITTQEFSRVVTDSQGRDHAVVSKGTTHRDTWVMTEKGWMLRSVEELVQGKEYVDGRPVTR